MVKEALGQMYHIYLARTGGEGAIDEKDKKKGRRDLIR